MILKQIINAVVTISLLFSIGYGLLITSAWALNTIDVLEKTDGGAEMPTFLFLALIAVLAFLGVIQCAIIGVLSILVGTGILWKRVDAGDVLEDESGRIVHTFAKGGLVWRFNSFFNGKKFKSCD